MYYLLFNWLFVLFTCTVRYFMYFDHFYVNYILSFGLPRGSARHLGGGGGGGGWGGGGGGRGGAL
jgi:hypothetical protein